jgi:hypothetical protein
MREEQVPRIEFDVRYSDHTPADLAAVLDARQADIETLIEVSRDMPGVIPPSSFGEPGATADEHLGGPRGRVLNATRVLRADGVRLHEAGDDAGAFRRLGAAARISLAFARQADEHHALMGLGRAATTLYDVAPIVNDGLRGTPEPEDVAAILEACDHLREHAPIRSPKLDRAIADIEAPLRPLVPG